MTDNITIFIDLPRTNDSFGWDSVFWSKVAFNFVNPPTRISLSLFTCCVRRNFF